MPRRETGQIINHPILHTAVTVCVTVPFSLRFTYVCRTCAGNNSCGHYQCCGAGLFFSGGEAEILRRLRLLINAFFKSGAGQKTLLKQTGVASWNKFNLFKCELNTSNTVPVHFFFPSLLPLM